jgi:hypothetical protein
VGTLFLDLGFLGAIGLILWLAARQERWLDRQERLLPQEERDTSPADDVHQPRRAA